MISRAATTGAEPLDTVVTIVSPENIAFRFRLAGPAARTLAFLIDILAIALVAVFLVLVLGFMGVAAEVFGGLLIVAFFFLWWGYGAACEVLTNGRTAGKAVLGLRVVSQTGLSINPAQAILRNLLRLVDVAPPFFPGVLTMACTRRLQRLGDLAAGTMVVLDRSQRAPRWPRAETAATAVVPAGFVAGPRLVEALASYVDRRADLSPARRQELAGIAAARLCESWRVPPPPDADALLCGLYQTVIASAKESS